MRTFENVFEYLGELLRVFENFRDFVGGTLGSFGARLELW